MYGLARPLLFAFDAEHAHGLGLASLEALSQKMISQSAKVWLYTLSMASRRNCEELRQFMITETAGK